MSIKHLLAARSPILLSPRDNVLIFSCFLFVRVPLKVVIEYLMTHACGVRRLLLVSSLWHCLLSLTYSPAIESSLCFFWLFLLIKTTTFVFLRKIAKSWDQIEVFKIKNSRTLRPYLRINFVVKALSNVFLVFLTVRQCHLGEWHTNCFQTNSNNYSFWTRCRLGKLFQKRPLSKKIAINSKFDGISLHQGVPQTLC